MLNLVKISKSYKDKVILDQVNATFEEGKITALLGPSGAGKTTLAKIIASRLDFDQGEIILDEDRLTPKQKNKHFNDKVCLLNQDALMSLDPSQNIYHALKELAKVKKIYTSKKDFLSLLEKLFKQVNLPLNLLKRKPRALSGGEGQRICFIKALLNESKVVIGDESLAMVDEINKRELINLYRNYAKEKHAIFILISHDENILHYVDKAYRLNNLNLSLIKGDK